jgi:propanol-preferring alcohol dehydrogenase
MKAARLQSPRKPLKIVEVEDPEPKPGEVVVKVSSSGVCHSDRDISDGLQASASGDQPSSWA